VSAFLGLAVAGKKRPKPAAEIDLEAATRIGDRAYFVSSHARSSSGKLKSERLLVPLLNPDGLIAGERARFGEPVTLDLGGLGVRGLSFWRGRYLILAGHFDGGAAPKLLTWDGHQHVAAIASDELSQYNPEGFFTSERRDRILILSDEGSRVIGSIECKRLKDPSQSGSAAYG
jgi:hypothetical protein